MHRFAPLIVGDHADDAAHERFRISNVGRIDCTVRVTIENGDDDDRVFTAEPAEFLIRIGEYRYVTVI